MRRALVALFLGWCLVASVSPASADDRSTTMPKQMKATGVYLEASPAQGDLALWRKRLEAGVKKADLGVPLHVALWTEAEDLWPKPSDMTDNDDAGVLRVLGLPRHSVALLSSETGFVLIEHDVTGRAADPIEAWETRAQAVVRRIVAASPDPERYLSMTSVAQAWVYLRLAAPNAPAPQKLVAELSGDVSLLDDSAAGPEDPLLADDGEDVYSDPRTFVAAGVVVLGAIALFLYQTKVGRRATLAERVAAPTTRGPDLLLASLTPLAVEQEVTDLAEQVAGSDVSPGDPAYDAAQGFLDAAAKYVDSDRERDRVGVHLLVADGRVALAGEDPPRRCYFHPMHAATTSVKRREVSLPCCPSCAGAVTRGAAPPALLVTGDDGEVRAYYETDDVWTSTGYGAIDERWARRALLAALGAR